LADSPISTEADSVYFQAQRLLESPFPNAVPVFLSSEPKEKFPEEESLKKLFLDISKELKTSAPRTKPKRGHKGMSEAAAKKRKKIVDAWESGHWTSKKDLALKLKIPTNEVTKAVDWYRKSPRK
jgi:hypothetical protein